ncbi:MAG: DUF4232 domain-containing protein [Streptosporangiaceae bacterium]|nr:DUF4232 domain-containing protein [Streptosporangiaceae bacterium]
MTHRTPGIWRAAMLPLLCAGVVAGCSPSRATVAAPSQHVIAWDDAVPSQLQPPQVPPAPACRAAQLSVSGSGFQFVAGVAGGDGAVALRNTGPGRCRLTGYPTVRLTGAPRAPAQRQVDLPVQAPAFPEVAEPAAMLRALAPGSAAILSIDWSNWCVPGAAGSAKPQIPPSAVRVTLGKGLGSLDVNYNAVPACDAPGQPATIDVRPFAPPPLPTTQPWTTANVTAAIESPDGPGFSLTAKRGQVARFIIRLQNASPIAVRFGGCPLLAEALAPSGQTEIHRLNCRPAGAILPGHSLLFDMRVRVPSSAPLGKNGLFWELDPTGAQYPEAVSGVVVTS